MATSQGTTVGIKGIGGQLHLRTTFNSQQQKQSMQQQNQDRHKGYLKGMLAKKFLHKHNLDTLGPLNSSTHKKEQAIQRVVTQQFDSFIDQNNFTEKNLEKFESYLLTKLDKIFKEHGIDDAAVGANRKIREVELAASPMGNLNYIKQTGGNLTSRFSRGKTAQNGRNGELVDGLPSIGMKLPSNGVLYGKQRSFKTPSNALNNGPIMRNNLINHTKNNASYEAPKYGNLMKLNTLEDETSRNDRFLGMNNTGMKNTEQNFMQNKKYADLRIQAGKKKCVPDKYTQKTMKPNHAEEVESVPSELGEDQWAEINNYDYALFQEQKKKEKEEFQQKRQMVRNTLQKQLAEQAEVKQKNIEYNQQMDSMMLKKAKKELELEKRKKHEQQKMIQLQKAQRDVMMLEAQRKKMTEYQGIRNGEIKEVEKLQSDLAEQKKKEKAKKLEIFNAAQKVIKDNENDRKERQVQLKKDKLHQVKLQEEYIAMLDAQDKKRAEVAQARIDKIEKMMNSMGDVLKKSDAAEKAEEVRLLNQQLQKDRAAEKAEKDKKEAARIRQLKINETLGKQIEERHQFKANLQDENQKYIKMVISQDEKDKKKQKDDMIKALAKRKEVQNIQKLQMMGGDPNMIVQGLGSDGGSQVGGTPLSSNTSLRRKAAAYGSHMSVEELRLNKAILKEISKKKKADMTSQDNYSRQVASPK